MKKSDKKLLVKGGIAGLLGSLCCFGPVVLVAFGLVGVSTALSIGKYTSVFLGFAVIFLLVGVYAYLRERHSCNALGVRKNWKVILLAFLILAIFLFILKYRVAPWLAEIVYV